MNLILQITRNVCLFVVFFLAISATAANKVIEVTAEPGSNNQNLLTALKKAAALKGAPITIKMAPGVYNFTRDEAVQKLMHVSNTTSEVSDPDPTKHIALMIESLKNVTIDGCGATLMMNGEMTSFVIDHSENITLKNLNIDNNQPTQTELTVVKDGPNFIIAEVHPTSQYKVENGKLTWYGDGWSFSQGIAQSYNPVTNLTERGWSPMDGLKHTVEMRKNLLYMQYDRKPVVKEGIVYQMRDGVRDEVCGFINRSKNVRVENVNFWFLGNFGVVCQFSDGIAFQHSNFVPKPGSGRTNAGFADFIQVSGCKGMVDISNCSFAGAHDDPINIHGTHLKVVKYLDARTVKVRFMHHETFGFEAFFKGDAIEMVNAKSLRAVMKGKVTKAVLDNPREMVLTFDRTIPAAVKELDNVVVENVTWTPEVRIVGNYFSRIPTRGILLSTRRKSLIENNIFHGMYMSAILIADDAMSWYESGPVHQLTIRKNTFLECGGPNIWIAPEIKTFEGTVHKNIVIEENTFESANPKVEGIYARGVNGLIFRNNFFDLKSGKNIAEIKECENVVLE